MLIPARSCYECLPADRRLHAVRPYHRAQPPNIEHFRGIWNHQAILCVRTFWFSANYSCNKVVKVIVYDRVRCLRNPIARFSCSSTAPASNGISTRNLLLVLFVDLLQLLELYFTSLPVAAWIDQHPTQAAKFTIISQPLLAAKSAASPVTPGATGSAALSFACRCDLSSWYYSFDNCNCPIGRWRWCACSRNCPFTRSL